MTLQLAVEGEQQEALEVEVVLPVLLVEQQPFHLTRNGSKVKELISTRIHLLERVPIGFLIQ